MVALHVVEAGRADAPTLLFLHGVGNSQRTFGFAADALADRAHVLLADLRGHGASPRVPDGYRLPDYVGDVEALLDEVGPAYVVGNSLGGAIAWTLAQRRPELIRAALLEDPPLRPADVSTLSPIFRALRHQVTRWQDGDVDPATVAAALGAMPVFGGRPAAEVQGPDVLEARARGLLDVDPAALGAVADGTGLAALDLTTPVTVPVRVLAADESTGSVLPASAEAALANAYPDVPVRRFPRAGHVIHDELAHREEWLAEVEALLER
ncbi:alpha/beta fold hydrolase [Actinomycetospora termitidis]|uniref:Alpha/beta fold hydrolase n=1 Tax=Actinomycetospora termitidis TaxID=3053470 RepID=A0ABT7MI88_9PSEU|nr:alpha/beta fold hydrolase [Actinomycetospora sp. Odt1-22]MDL5160380.1 alpha/beta fold hydrolase [Actinomycetospora sp. Odt1-22]